MRKGSACCLLASFFVMQSDQATLSQFDYRFSLMQSELHLEIGIVNSFEPYAYVLQNRHDLAEELQERFPIDSNVEIDKMGEYEVSYRDDLLLHVIVEDTTPPKLTLRDLTLNQDEAFTWNETNKEKVILELRDNETDDETLQANLHCDDIDTSSSGKQRVSCEVNDNSGNITSAELAVWINAPDRENDEVSITPRSHVLSVPIPNYRRDQLAEIQEVATLVNQIRKEYGLAPLILDMGNYHSVTYARTLEVYTTYSHVRPDGRACYTIFSDYGMLYGSVGENIARGQQNAQAVVKDWMNSPTHRENILRAEFTRISIGVMGSGSRKVWVQEFFS